MGKDHLPAIRPFDRPDNRHVGLMCGELECAGTTNLL
jgi:hypothetical protein